MVTKLNSMAGRYQVQERFHPPASFEHSIAHGNAMNQKKKPIPEIASFSSSNSRPPRGPDITNTKPAVSNNYDYQPFNFAPDGSKPSYFSTDDYLPSNSGPKVRLVLKYNLVQDCHDKKFNSFSKTIL